MKIVSARAYSKNLKLSKPYEIARQRYDSVENVFLEVLLDNGITGIGAANPDPEVVNETPAETLQLLQQKVIPWITGKDIRLFNQHIYELETATPDKPGTLAALDIALHDAFGQLLGIPVVDLYGRKHAALPTSVTIGIMPLQQTIEEARAFKSGGFKVIKLKTGQSPEEDAEKVIKLHESFGKHFTIRVDANTGYDIDDLNQFLKLTNNYPVELIEQPLLPSEDQLLDRLPTAVRHMLAADESLKNAKSAYELCRNDRFGIYNIKLMKCGGIRAALKIAAVTEPTGAKLFWGCNDESIVSITAALHAAYACQHTRYIDLDGSFDLAEDLVSGGFTVKDGMMYINDKAGLGIQKR